MLTLFFCCLLDMPMSRSIVLSGPSGCGKSTLIKKLMKDYPDHFGFSVSRKNAINFLSNYIAQC